MVNITSEEFKQLEILRLQFNKANKFFDRLELKINDLRGLGELSVHTHSKLALIDDEDFGKISALCSNIHDLVLIQLEKEHTSELYIEQYTKMRNQVEDRVQKLKNGIVNRKKTILEGLTETFEVVLLIVAKLPIIRELIQGVGRLMPGSSRRSLSSAEE